MWDMKFKELYNKHGWCLRLCLFLFLPIILSFILFPYGEQVLNLFNENYSASISGSPLLSPLMESSISNLLKIPFDLQKYHVCFQDLGSYVYYSDNTKDYSGASWTVNFNHTTSLIVKSKSKNCTLVKANENFTYSWTGNFNVILEVGALVNGTLVRGTKSPLLIIPIERTYVIPEEYGLFTIYILFFVSWNTIFYLFTRIVKVIKEGFLK